MEKRAKVEHNLLVAEAEFNNIQEGGQKCIIIQSIGQFQVGDDLLLVEMHIDMTTQRSFSTKRTFKTFITDIIEGNNIIGLQDGYAVISFCGGGFLEFDREGTSLGILGKVFAKDMSESRRRDSHEQIYGEVPKEVMVQEVHR